MNKKNFKLIKPTINDIAKYVPGESKINGEKNVIKLSSNESPFVIPKNFFLLQKTLEQAHLFPDGDSTC